MCLTLYYSMEMKIFYNVKCVYGRKILYIFSGKLIENESGITVTL